MGRIEIDEDLVREYYWNPQRFIYDVFGMELWDRQSEMISSIVDNSHVAWKTGHKTGKSTSQCLIAFWWALTRRNARVGITSASYLQVKKIIWREMRRIWGRAKVPLGGQLFDDPRTGIRLHSGNEIFGFSTDAVENAAGFSSENMLFLCDEASGKGLDDIMEALEGNIAGGGKIGMWGNPTRTNGVFFDAFTAPSSIWHTGTISSEESINVREGRVVIPGLATKPWIELRKREWGTNHPLYLIRVAGQFPRYADTQIVPYFLVDQSQADWKLARIRQRGDLDEEKTDIEMIRWQNGPIQIGLDVGRHGKDDSVLQIVRGEIALEPRNFSGLDGPALAMECLSVLEWLRDHDELSAQKCEIHLKVDEIGVGSSPYDHLKLKMAILRMMGVKLVPVNAATSPMKPDMYYDQNIEWLFNLRHWLESGGKLPPNPRLTKEILFPEYYIDEQGRYRRVYSKKEERKEINIGHSPDNRDALVMAISRKVNVVSPHVSGGRRAAGQEGFRAQEVHEDPFYRGGGYIDSGTPNESNVNWIRNFSG